MIGDPLNVEIWDRLLKGKSLDELSLPTKEGRIDLGGFLLPEPPIVRRCQTPFADVSQIEPTGVFNEVEWRDLDFSGSTLNSLRFYESEVSNCRFDKCQLKDLRLWASTIRDTSFWGADLRESALGAATVEGTLSGKRNMYVGVDFTEADLRGTSYVAAAFGRCTFRNTKLVKIDFGTSTFVDCQFEGELREVRFWRCGFQGNAFPPNEMVNVDFSRAKLRDVEFRGLSLDRVRLPSDAEHIVIKNFAAVLARLIDILTGQGDQTAKILTAYLGGYQKWADPKAPGILNTRDLAEAGDDAVTRVRGLLQQLGVKLY